MFSITLRILQIQMADERFFQANHTFHGKRNTFFTTYVILKVSAVERSDLMLYLLGGIVLLVGVAWCFTGMNSLRQKDEFGAKQPMDDAIAHQTLHQIDQHNHHI